jgi:O-antigen/teichoic acid export membrane protein
MCSVDSVVAIANRRRLFINMLSGTGYLIISAALAFLLMPFYLRYLGATGFGIVGLITILMGFTAIMDLGLTASVNRKIAQLSCSPEGIKSIQDLLRTFELIFLGWGGSAFLLVMIFSPRLSSWINISEQEGNRHTIFILIATCALFRWVSCLYQSCLLGMEKQVLCNGLRIIEVCFQHGVGITLLYFRHINITQYLIWILINIFLFLSLSAVATWFMVPGRFRSFCRGRFHLIYIIEIWRFALGLATVTIASTVFIMMDRFFVSIKSTTLLGFYIPSVAVATQVSALFSTPVFNAAYPNMTRLFEKKNFSGIVHHYFFILSIVASLAFSFLWFIGNFKSNILVAWFPTNTDGIRDMINPILFWCILGPILNTLAVPGYTVQLSHGKPKLAAICTTALLPVAALGYYWQLKENGLLGLVIVKAIVNTITMLVSLFLTHRLFLKNQTLRLVLTVLTIAGLASIVAMVWHLVPYPNSASRYIRIIWLGGAFSLMAGITAGIGIYINGLIERILTGSLSNRKKDNESKNGSSYND